MSVIVDEKKLKDSIQDAAADAKQLAENAMNAVKLLKEELAKLPDAVVNAINTAHKGFFDSVQRRAEQLLALSKTELPCAEISWAILAFSINDLRPAFENLRKISELQQAIRVKCAIKPKREEEEDVSMIYDDEEED